MSQAENWSVPLNGPVNPVAYSERIDESLDALLSSHSGSARPPYAVAGTIWLSTSTAGLHKYYFFDGLNDHLVFTIDTATGAIQYADGVVSDALGMRVRVDAAQNFSAAQRAQARNNISAALKGHLVGLNFSNNATDAANDIDIDVGEAASDATNAVLMVLGSPITKRLDAAWAAGSGSGGWLDGSAMPNGTGHIFLIQRSDTGAVDIGASASISPTLPSNYDRKRRIASIVREGGANVPITQDGDIFRRAPKQDYNSAAARASALLTLSVPTGIGVFPMLTELLSTVTLNATAVNSLGSAFAGSADVVVGQVNLGGATGVSVDVGQIPAWFKSNAAAQIYFSVAVSGAVQTNQLTTVGWIDTRGKI